MFMCGNCHKCQGIAHDVKDLIGVGGFQLKECLENANARYWCRELAKNEQLPSSKRICTNDYLLRLTALDLVESLALVASIVSLMDFSIRFSPSHALVSRLPHY